MNIQLKTDGKHTPMLTGKVALVTGSTSGIGLGIARALAGAGAAVVLNGLGAADEVAKTKDDLAREYGVKVGYSPADMSKPKAIGEMIGSTLLEHGRLDILVNNAGVQHVAPLEQFPPEKWDQILAINLSSAFHTIRLALPAMRERGYGRIINIASAHGLVASPFKAAYVAAKHGIVGLTKVAALEAAEQGITCNAICPGYVYTPLVEAQIDGQAKAHGISRDQVIRDVLLAQQPNKRFATVEEIGALTAFLASEAAASITGTALPVDGGWTAH
ncbi:3-hydroxybutyrate dehydrogenase [Bradyrhizobium sp.]|uniref:3-hydroxybutyrate dehydrogenase n=1 Tax=Bradyrhizobium sp. TaxID=376 RepID=UPI001EC4B214|nr:3-hydroxybutyrate dehydrogenase [Bradyrhizobium sp.]MBV8923346.1 3-hydroxybutyrate dehydrogenase [Bradyrhizobium sp.]MBV9979552.1 3-hydroxybutyrate dehydrogenase [Bradyrhizobium sp.]